jgi:hypothetical protein
MTISVTTAGIITRRPHICNTHLVARAASPAEEVGGPRPTGRDRRVDAVLARRVDAVPLIGERGEAKVSWSIQCTYFMH